MKFVSTIMLAAALAVFPSTIGCAGADKAQVSDAKDKDAKASADAVVVVEQPVASTPASSEAQPATTAAPTPAVVKPEDTKAVPAATTVPATDAKANTGKVEAPVAQTQVKAESQAVAKK